MVRTAYDADTQQYTFLDTTDGTHYVSAPGAKYGTLVPVATADFPKASRTSGRRQTRKLSVPQFLPLYHPGSLLTGSPPPK